MIKYIQFTSSNNESIITINTNSIVSIILDKELNTGFVYTQDGLEHAVKETDYYKIMKFIAKNDEVMVI